MGNTLRAAVGDMPGAKEAEAGDAFAGGTGTWFPILYHNVGMPKASVLKDISYINVVSCRLPTKKDTFPTEKAGRELLGDREAFEAVKHCEAAYVQPFLKSRPWERVDTFGEYALRTLTGKQQLDTYRGSPLSITALGTQIRTVPTYDAGRIMAEQEVLPLVVNDLRKNLELDPEKYNIRPSLEEVKNFTATSFAFDLETNRWNNQSIYMIGFSASEYEAIVVPWTEEYIPEIKRIFANAKEIVGQNHLQFDNPILRDAGIHIPPPEVCTQWDIMLMHHLRFPKFKHRLELIGSQLTNKGAWKSDKASFETYCARDVDVTWRSFLALKQLLDQASLTDIYKYVSWPLALIARHMTNRGFRRSSARLKTLREQYIENIAREQVNLPEELRTRFSTKRKRVVAPEGTVNAKGKPVKFLMEDVEVVVTPWKSPAIKLDWLYSTDKFDLPKQYKIGTTNVTTDKTALDRLYNRLLNPSQAFVAKYGNERIAELRRYVRAIKELNAWAHRLSGFAKESQETVDEFIHPSFNVHGTVSGRLSSSAPNMQNVPEEARFMYVPRNEGGRIVSIDYGGIENRLTAFIAGDTARQKWLADPEYSEHKYLASVLEGIPYDQVVKSKDKDSWYMIAKAVVHGSDRLIGSKKIWEKNDLDPDTVKTVHGTWKNLIRGTVQWQYRCADEVKRTGVAKNLFGRKLWFWESNRAPEIISFFPQSTAFDVIARAMIGLMFERIGWPRGFAEKVCPLSKPLPLGADLNLQVHDELVVETETADVVDETVATMTEVMTQPWKELKGLRLPVGVGVGESWGECS